MEIIFPASALVLNHNNIEVFFLALFCLSLSEQFLSFHFISDEFRSKVACENDTIQLVCNPYSRIAVYSASFGRTSYESIQCSQPQGVMEECKYYYFG